MKRPLLILALLSTACYASQQSGCDAGSGPSPTPTPTPTASPTPAPSPTPTPLAAYDCRREFDRVDYLYLTGPANLVVGEQGTYHLTPRQFCTEEGGATRERDVPDHFNRPKASSVDWDYTPDRSLGTLVEDGFAAYFTRRANLSGGGLAPPVTIRVTFEGKFAQKVVQ